MKNCFIFCLIVTLSQTAEDCPTCLKKQCDADRRCTSGCVPGYIGIYCDRQCPANCKNETCYIDKKRSEYVCTDGCQDGYCGAQCMKGCHGNSTQCDRLTCTNITRQCPGGRYGINCSEECDENYETCDKDYGRCIRCKQGFFGDVCRQECRKCLSEENNGYTCQSGCEICHPPGCQSGYYGRTCNYTCSELCVSRVCHQHNATCQYGCISGYEDIHGVCEKSKSEETPNVLAIAIVIPIVLVLIGVCVCVLVIVIRRHKRQREYKKRRQTTGTELEEVTTPLQTDRDNQPSGTELEEVTTSLQTDTDNQPDGTSLQTDTDNQTNDSQDTVTKPLLNQNNQDTKGKSVDSQQPSSNSSDPELLPEERLQIKRLRERCTQEIHMETKGMIRVSAIHTVIQKLKTGQNWVTITGNAGDGKTKLGHLVLKEFLDKMSVYKIDEPEEYKILSKLKEDRLILLDDRFGAFLADQSLIKNWLEVIKKLLNFHENYPQHKKLTQVIFISRKNVVKESHDYLGHCKDKMFDPECIVDLSAIKVIGEREKILNYHLNQEKLTVKPEVKKSVIDLNIAHGFPHCCKMYSKLKSKGYDIDIEEFFKSPLKFLDITTRVLYKENCKDLFKLLIKNDGKFNVFSIKDEDKRQALLQVEREQEGSYITTWKKGMCKFAHPSVYESVLNVINDIDPLYCVQYATLSVIRQKIIISTSDDKDKDKSACYIIVKPVPEVLQTLAERFRKEILEGIYSVFEHRLCDNKEFCEALVTCCVCTDPNMKSKQLQEIGGDR